MRTIRRTIHGMTQANQQKCLQTEQNQQVSSKPKSCSNNSYALLLIANQWLTFRQENDRLVLGCWMDNYSAGVEFESGVCKLKCQYRHRRLPSGSNRIMQNEIEVAVQGATIDPTARVQAKCAPSDKN